MFATDLKSIYDYMHGHFGLELEGIHLDAARTFAEQSRDPAATLRAYAALLMMQYVETGTLAADEAEAAYEEAAELGWNPYV